MMFLMCVDYHCREEVGMDIPEDEESVRLNTLGASAITLDKTQFVVGVALSKRHLFISAGMITMGEMCNEHILSSGQERPRPPSSPFGTGPRYRRGEDHVPPHVPPPDQSPTEPGGGTRPGRGTHVPPRPLPPPGGGWSRPSDDVGCGGPSRARARRRRRRSGRGNKGEPRRGQEAQQAE